MSLAEIPATYAILAGPVMYKDMITAVTGQRWSLAGHNATAWLRKLKMTAVTVTVQYSLVTAAARRSLVNSIGHSMPLFDGLLLMAHLSRSL